MRKYARRMDATHHFKKKKKMVSHFQCPALLSANLPCITGTARAQSKRLESTIRISVSNSDNLSTLLSIYLDVYSAHCRAFEVSFLLRPYPRGLLTSQGPLLARSNPTGYNDENVSGRNRAGHVGCSSPSQMVPSAVTSSTPAQALIFCLACCLNARK
jgi:hypothetical protein